MGADSSKPDRLRHQRDDAEGGGSGPSLWEGVPPEVAWLAKTQVRLLLSSHASALLHRPESLASMEEEEDASRRGELQPHETALATAALRDRALAPRLQKVLDRLVPAHLAEATFWDNFFSHVDVIKVRVVTDFLNARDCARAEREAKHAGWVRLYDAMEDEMKHDLRRAAERIAARQQPPPPSAVELQLGGDTARRPERWRPDGEAWLEYVEDGPHEVLEVLKAALALRADPGGTPATATGGGGEAGSRSPLWSSPTDRAPTPRLPEEEDTAEQVAAGLPPSLAEPGAPGAEAGPQPDASGDGNDEVGS